MFLFILLIPGKVFELRKLGFKDFLRVRESLRIFCVRNLEMHKEKRSLYFRTNLRKTSKFSVIHCIARIQNI